MPITTHLMVCLSLETSSPRTETLTQDIKTSSNFSLRNSIPQTHGPLRTTTILPPTSTTLIPILKLLMLITTHLMVCLSLETSSPRTETLTQDIKTSNNFLRSLTQQTPGPQRTTTISPQTSTTPTLILRLPMLITILSMVCLSQETSSLRTAISTLVIKTSEFEHILLEKSIIPR